MSSHTAAPQTSEGTPQPQNQQASQCSNENRQRQTSGDLRNNREQLDVLSVLASQRDEYKQKYAEAEKSSVASKDEATRLAQELSALEKEKQQIKSGTEKLQPWMSKGEIIFGEQLPDDIIQPKFCSLISSIAAWSGRFTCVGRISPATMQEEDLPIYAKVISTTTSLDSLHMCFEEKKHRKLFVRGWAAYVMCDTIFFSLPSSKSPESNAQDCFVDTSVSKAIRILEMNLGAKEPEKVNDWRAFTLTLLSQNDKSGDLPKSASKTIQQACRRVLSVIEPWDQKKAEDSSEKSLIAIFEEAVRFSQLIRQQRASWTVQFPQVTNKDESVPGGILPYDGTCMEVWGADESDDITKQEQQGVEVVVTPALMKRGNADGEQLDVETCMAKAKVVLSFDDLL